jgi:formate hydrogenlyase subunit 6/NADH:ubiquinone oxidoreductase subunit I
MDDDLHIPIVCVECGACARFCPYECLEMVEVEAKDYIKEEERMARDVEEEKNAG